MQYFIPANKNRLIKLYKSQVYDVEERFALMRPRAIPTINTFNKRTKRENLSIISQMIKSAIFGLFKLFTYGVL